jgi:hypothetical protein
MFKTHSSLRNFCVKGLFVLLIPMLLSGPAKADNCIGQFVDLEHFNGILGATVTITQQNGTVSYAKFASLLHNAGITGPAGNPIPARFTGRTIQLFNDRDQNQPFPVAQKDDLALEIRAGSDVVVTFTLLSWKNGKMGFTASCDGGLMHGYSNGAVYAISFQKGPLIQ